MDSELRRSITTFEPSSPPRSGRLIFQSPGDPARASEWSIAEAVPALCRARFSGAHPTVEFWRAATLAAVEQVKERRIVPDVQTVPGSVIWRLDRSADDAAVRAVESAAPAAAGHVGEYLDAVADFLASPDVNAGVGVALRVELPGGLETLEGSTPDERFIASVQVHALADPATVVDLGELWTDAERFGPGARAATMLGLRRAAVVWAPLERLLKQQVPDRLPMDDDDLSELLGGGAERLAAAGIGTEWPAELATKLGVTAVIPTSGPLSHPRSSPRQGHGSETFDSTEPLHLSWRFTLGGTELTQTELDQIATARQPFMRVRGQWVLVDPRLAEKASETEPKTVNALDALGAALTGTAEIGGERVAVEPTGWLEKLRNRIAAPEAGDELIKAPIQLSATLRDYQLRGLRWLHRMTSLGLGACLADDMGLGKTITVIALHLQRQSDPSTAGRTLVVCPASLMGNWEREIERFAPGTPVRRFHGSSRDIEAAVDKTDGGFVITTYGTMRVDASDNDDALATAPWGMLVADEAQHIKNARSKTAQALRTIPANARIALTGTPVENNLAELWAIMDWTTPGLLGSRNAFRARWADPIESGREPHATDAAQHLTRLISPFLLRRRKSDPGIAPELPPKTVTDRPVSLTPEQVRLYEATVRETMERITASDGIVRRGLVLSLLTALKQICNHPAQYLKEPLGSSGRSGKLDLLDELVTTITSEDDAVLVFTQYVSMARLLDQHLGARGVPVQVLHGGTPVDQREQMVRRFQESPDGEAPVFVLSLKAAGTGLNLTRAGHVIHYDRWWNPAVEEQATDRAYRIGQNRPVQVHRLIAEGTVEDRIAAMLEAKRDLADAVLCSGEAALSELSDAELAELVELRGAHE